MLALARLAAMVDGEVDAGRRRTALRRYTAGALLLLGIMVAASVWAWTAVPPGAEVPLHRGITGEVTRTGDSTVLLLLLPVITLLMAGVLGGVLASGGTDLWEPEPREPADPGAMAWFGLGVLSLLAVLHVVILLDATGTIDAVDRVLLGATAAYAVLFGVLLVRERSGEHLLRTSVNVPRPAGAAGRRAVRHAVGGGFAGTGALVAVAAVTGPPWLAPVLLVVGLVAACVGGLAASLRHR
jgi:hypothetical protein